MNLSFAGCGFLGIYHIGVACCFKQYAPHLLLDKIAGASAGAIAACCLLCDQPIGGMISDVLNVIGEARKGFLGPFTPRFSLPALLRESLDNFLPEDAHMRVSGKLRVSLTRLDWGKTWIGLPCFTFENHVVTDFESREELLEALLASAFVPGFSGWFPPVFRGKWHMDGGLSDNLPTLDENTITVSPFCGESDICPRDMSSQLFHLNVANTSIELSKPNLDRILMIIWPPKPETLSKMCKQGFDDALKFLIDNNLINCTNCLAVQSTFVLSRNSEESCEHDPECKQCKIHSQEAFNEGEVPDTVMSIFQEQIDAANRGLMNGLCQRRGIKSFLAFIGFFWIYLIPFLYALAVKLLFFAPKISSGFRVAMSVGRNLLGKVFGYLRIFDRRGLDTASITCQLEVTRYGDFNHDMDQFQETVRNQVINFEVDLGADPGHNLGEKILSRRSSLVIHKTDQDHVEDTLDQILKVTSQHDAVMAYYYMDEDNKVQVTEIFDVTKAETEAIFHEETPSGNVSALRLEEEVGIPENVDKENGSRFSDISAEYNFDGENQGIFSDPESDWSPSSVCKETQEEKLGSFGGSDTRPESDQNGT